jgi:hypothetical protein
MKTAERPNHITRPFSPHEQGINEKVDLFAQKRKTVGEYFYGWLLSGFG